MSPSFHTWTTLQIRTNFKIPDNPYFTNKQFYLNPSLKKKKNCASLSDARGRKLPSPIYKLHSASINLGPCQLVGAQWTSPPQQLWSLISILSPVNSNSSSLQAPSCKELANLSSHWWQYYTTYLRCFYSSCAIMLHTLIYLSSQVSCEIAKCQ